MKERPPRSRPMDAGNGTEPRPRYRKIRRGMQITSGLALAAALGGVILPGRARTAASVLAVALVISAPLARVLWLAVRWWRWGDRRYAAVAASVLFLVATGAVLALLTR